MNSIRAAIYARVSSEQQAAAHTIESQLAALSERAQVDGLQVPPERHEDPDGNIIELNTNNFANDWTVTEQLKALPSQVHINVDPEKMVAARKAGASPWEVHDRAVAGEFTPAVSYDLHTTRWQAFARRGRPVESKATIAARVLLGLVFFGFGLNGLLKLFPLPPARGAAAVFIGGLIASQYFFPLLFVTYVLTGAALLTGRFVPLALTVLAPVIVNCSRDAPFRSLVGSGSVSRGDRKRARSLPHLVVPRGISAAFARALRTRFVQIRWRVGEQMIGSKPYTDLKYREVRSNRMAYVDEGEGGAIVFQHGQPTSSYVWRNVMPHLDGMGRLVACDLIGMARTSSTHHLGRTVIASLVTETIFSICGIS